MSDLSNENEDMKWTNYRRQRRNFFLITVFMFALAFTNSDVKQISFLGNIIESNNTGNIKYLLWLTFFYFMLRYYYTHKEIYDHSMRATFEKMLLTHYGTIAFNKEIASRSDLQESAKKRLSQSLAKDESLDDYIIYNHMHAPISDTRNGDICTIRTNWAIISENKHTGNVDELKVDSAFITINYSKIRWMKFKTWFKLLTSKYYFTEYYLPYVFALITLVLSVCVGKFIF